MRAFKRGLSSDNLYYLVNITCIIARFKPGEYSDEYSPPGQYETVDYTSRAIFSDFAPAYYARFPRNKILLHLNIDHRKTKSLKIISKSMKKISYMNKY